MLSMPEISWARPTLLDAWHVYKVHGYDNWYVQLDLFMLGMGLQHCQVVLLYVPVL